jgi:endonuclease/exonuclease/phosphatase family metal-dependent hydrolase
VSAFSAPSAEERAVWLARLGEPGAHAAIAAGASCLEAVDVASRRPADGVPSSGWIRVAAWNVERGRSVAGLASVLSAVDADVVLLSEVDRGMARSGNVDVFADVAAAIDMADGAYAVEFVELGLGDAGERAACEAAGRTSNLLGLHGNAVLSRIGLSAPRVLRLDEGGDWFTSDRGQPRVGGRVAVAGWTGPFVAVSVHLESSSTAEERAAQLDQLLAMVDDRFGAGVPAVVGGDLNTFGAPMSSIADRSHVRSMRSSEPARFSWPVPHEPLFERAAARGYSWVDANVAAPTTHHGPDSLPDHVPLHLDWLLVRGVEARRAAVVSSDGLSDHELVAVNVRDRSS